MPSYIRLDRLREAVIRLSDWRGQVKQQTVAHVLPLLALLEKGVNKSTYVQFEEQDDFDFFDRYSRLPGDEEKPYFDPFNRSFRIASHPHSNIATARKNTFARRWKAAELNEGNGQTRWQLNPEYANAIVQNILVKGNTIVRISVVDLAIWLYREETFTDNADSAELLKKFRSQFVMDDADFNLIFSYESEPSEALFQTEQVAKEDIDGLLRSLAYVVASQASTTTPVTAFVASTSATNGALDEADPILTEVKALIALGTSGVILRGAPGTGKSWYAQQIALALCNGAEDRIFRIQFHPSFTYEDFFEGYVPDEDKKSGFRIEPKPFRTAIKRATETAELVVLIVDEINRGDTSRIFGETLTYIERGWRGISFIPRLTSEPVFVPQNLLVLATMNPHDRSITQLDMALLRRFDHVEIPPSSELASDFLTAAGMSEEHAGLVGQWFNTLQGMLPFGIGHTFFLNVGDVGQLGLIWRYRLLPFCESLLEFEPARLEGVRNSFSALDRRLRGVE